MSYMTGQKFHEIYKIMVAVGMYYYMILFACMFSLYSVNVPYAHLKRPSHQTLSMPGSAINQNS
jgi:hypothetical protein